MSEIRPLHDRILVKRIQQEYKTASGVIIPESAQEKPVEGEVVAVGNGSRDNSGTLRPLDVQKGDKVLFAKWGGTEVKVDGQEYLIMKESDVLAIIEK